MRWGTFPLPWHHILSSSHFPFSTFLFFWSAHWFQIPPPLPTPSLPLSLVLYLQSCTQHFLSPRVGTLHFLFSSVFSFVFPGSLPASHPISPSLPTPPSLPLLLILLLLSAPFSSFQLSFSPLFYKSYLHLSSFRHFPLIPASSSFSCFNSSSVLPPLFIISPFLQFFPSYSPHITTLPSLPMFFSLSSFIFLHSFLSTFHNFNWVKQSAIEIDEYGEIKRNIHSFKVFKWVRAECIVLEFCYIGILLECSNLKVVWI